MSQSMKALQAMLTEGISLTEAARRFGISKAAVSKAKLHPPIKRQMAQTIEQLTARVRELEEENAKLRADNIAFARNLKGKSATTGATYEHICIQLAAEQLNNKLLRDALQEYIDEHEECQDADDWMAMMCSMEAHHAADEALSQPSDTSALDTFVAEKVKEYGDEARRQMQHATKAVWQRDLAVEALEKIAAPVRVDGTYNRCREACEILARETLSAIKESEAK